MAVRRFADHLLSSLSLCTALFGAIPALAQPSYLLFESGPVRPVALSPNGQKLFVANTPDGYLEIFDVSGQGLLSPSGSVPVGLEPVAVAARNNGEVWVVNHLSDSVSIVDVASSPPRVVRTLLVGDEPRDIVFAGSPARAFISTAHRGQHRTHASLGKVPGAGDPQLTTASIGRADVWVFDAATPGSGLGGVPVAIESFFADTPRALATSADGNTVYVAAFHSGNRSTAILEPNVPNGFNSCTPGGAGVGVPGVSNNVGKAKAPETGVIVQFNGANWVDADGCTWSVPFSLPDRDVFALNANTLAAGSVFSQVGTILFNMAVNPVTGKLYVTNTESPNNVLFEGPGNVGGSTVQGHLSEARISVLDPAGPTATPRRLNPHIDYDQLHTDVGADHTAINNQIPHSLATPLQVAIANTPGDQKVYVAAFGSAKVGVLDASALEAGTFSSTAASPNYISTGGGPAGLALNAANNRLYVLTRFDQKITVFKVGGTSTLQVQSVHLHTPEPVSVVEGRPFLYDAVATSGNGEASCASCHIFGDFDSLAWNLGNPDDPVTSDPQPMSTPFFEGNTAVVGGNQIDTPNFHPMKGPMTTQTLRGLSTHGGMHWRGDRVNGFFGVDSCAGSPNSNAPCDEDLSFNNFIVAFEGLIGKQGTITAAEMQKFTDFALQLMLPPNPVANLDNSLTTDQQSGKNVYFSCGPGTEECVVFNPFLGTSDPDATDTVEDCDGCHNLDPIQGFFGSGGEKSFEGEPQNIKVPHLRNAYAKVGMFSVAGNQVRGFGFLHDGAVDTLKTFVGAGVFALDPIEENQLEQFMLAFPSDLAPIVGQQVSIGPGSPGSFTSTDVDSRIDQLNTSAAANFASFVLGGTVKECEVVAKTVESGFPRSYLRLTKTGDFQPDLAASPAIPEATLRNKADPSGNAQNIQYLCAPPGSGYRAGLDRDEDGVWNGDDNCTAWPNGAGLGTCTAGPPAELATECTTASDCGAGGVCSKNQEDANFDGTGDACELTVLPEPSWGPCFAAGIAFVCALAGLSPNAAPGGRKTRSRSRSAR